MSQLRLVGHLWGVPPARWAAAIPQMAKRGVWGIETPPHFLPATKSRDRLAAAADAAGDDASVSRDDLAQLLRDNDLKLIAQVHSDPYEAREVEVSQHLLHVRQQIAGALESFSHSGIAFFNIHSGCERWSETQIDEYLGGVAALEKEFGVVVAHETHRGRLLYSPWSARDILERWPSLRVTADVSHWVCVATGKLDRDWDIVDMLAKQTFHIHARVGTDQAPQVTDPRDPLNAVWVEHHEKIWQHIWRSQRERGMEFSTVVAEYGPPPYMPVLVGGEPVANREEIVEWAHDRLEQQFASLSGEK